MAGTSGKLGARSAVVTPRARSLPLLICPEAEGRLSKMIGTWLPSTSVSAGPDPL